MSARKNSQFVWHEVTWPRPFDPATALELLSHLAADHSVGTIAWEARSNAKKIHYLIGCFPEKLTLVKQVIKSHIENVRLGPTANRKTPNLTANIRVSHPSLALSTDRVLSAVRSILAGLASAKSKDEELVLQVMLGQRVAPRMLPDRPNDPHTSWLDLLINGVLPASYEARASMRKRAGSAGFKVIIRIGARAETPGKERMLISNLFGGMKLVETAGIRLHLSPESATSLQTARRPWRWPLMLSAPELVSLMGWPLGEGNLPGIAGVHPKVLPPPENIHDSDRPFAITSAAARTVKLGVSIRDSLQHTVLLGPTGAGKSNAMLNIISADIAAGRGVLLIDPKSDLTREVLARIPESRQRDVVVIDPADPRPVGLNPLASKRQNPALVADSILAVFKELYADSWGPRTQDILTGALLTLAHYPKSSLVWLPTLLTDASFRRKLTQSLSDPLGLEPFWLSYEAMSTAQREQAIAPVLNKLRQFLLRPTLRSILGQTEPLFDLNELFTDRKIVLISLNKGLIGSESARLLGSLVVSQLWPLILSRAKLPPERRRIVSVFIDEVQDYLSLPTDLADALSQARGLSVGFTIAHQYRNQLPPALRAGIDANARNKITFGLNAGDAHDMATMAPGLDASDFILLPRFGIYAHLMNGGHSTGWISGQTTPAVSAISDPAQLKAASAELYGRPSIEVEAEVITAIGLEKQSQPKDDINEAVGRRPRRQE